jgi:hypothetical protein
MTCLNIPGPNRGRKSRSIVNGRFATRPDQIVTPRRHSPFSSTISRRHIEDALMLPATSHPRLIVGSARNHFTRFRISNGGRE